MGNTLGTWGPTIKFPLVPAAAALDPLSGQLLTWSSFANDTFQQYADAITQTAYWDPGNGNVNEVPVYVGHDMFCPGVSYGFNGGLVVTGGDTDTKTSIFYSNSNSWKSVADMHVPRGYQSSTTLSDGRIFTIGGSWEPISQRGNKIAEVYDASSNTWTELPGCNVTAMLTNDSDPSFRADNHAWLFGWKNSAVFQAGPSKAMNWYFPNQTSSKGQGNYKPVGNRGANDQMCGPTAMYDATAGKILAVGGAPSYQDVNAVADAYIITIGDPGSTPGVEQINSMLHPRIFATTTILPNGQVFIVGGQTYGKPFSDANSILDPELWDPSTRSFTKMATGPTPRNYHSVAILMPNGTVFSGGGGLCGTPPNSFCVEGVQNNHYDGQLWTPPYLFDSNNNPAPRPQITSVSASPIKLGTSISVTITPASGSASVSFSIVRISSSTHTVNTDQRRAPLSSTRVGSSNTYTVTIPSDPGVILPGYWYLFALQNGVPSYGIVTQILP